MKVRVVLASYGIPSGPFEMLEYFLALVLGCLD